MKPENAAPAQPFPEEAFPESSGRILVVNEDPQDLQRLVNLLRERGYETTVAMSASQTLAKAKDAALDFVLIDDSLSGIDSPDFCRQFKTLSQERDLLALMLFAGKKNPEGTDLARNYACRTIEYLMKPVHPHNLAGVIRLQLALKRTEAAAAAYREQIRQESDDRVLLAKDKAWLKETLSEREKHIEQMAIIDDLTGLYNRKYIMERLAGEIAKSRRYAHHLSLILLDIDGLSDVNQIHGFSYGDSVLVKISETLQKGVREVDMIARFGGRTFLVLLPHTDADGALLTGERLEEAVSELSWDRFPVPVSVSRGISTLSPDRMADIGHSNPRNILYHLIMKADDQLYRNKESRRAQAEKESAKKGKSAKQD